MTKRQEIEILRDTIQALGRDSYCGPWLGSVVSFVESEILGDMPPSMSIRVAYEEARALQQERRDLENERAHMERKIRSERAELAAEQAKVDRARASLRAAAEQVAASMR